MEKSKLIKHHDENDCDAHLDAEGYCPKCKIHPDTQSTCFYHYCPECDIKLKNFKCPKCNKNFK
jgi:hypothetical protein